MIKLFTHPIFKSSLGLGLGFLGAFIGLFLSRVFLSNNLEDYSLAAIFGVGALSALTVVLSVEGFTSSLPVNIKHPLPYMRSLSIISFLLSLSVGGLLFLLSLLLPGYRFLLDYWWLVLLGIAAAVLISLGQLIETAAAMIGKDLIPFWRRSSIHLVALGVFALFFILANGLTTVWILLVWMLAVILGGIVSVSTSWLFLFNGAGRIEQEGLALTWDTAMKGYGFHHLSKLGIVLPRFILPVLVLALFGTKTSIEFIVLWTLLGLVSLMISAVSRSYMSHYELDGSIVQAWKSWTVLILIPASLVFLFSEQVLFLFGENYVALGDLLRIGILAFLPFSILDISLSRLRVMGKVKAASLISLISGIALVSISLVAGSLNGLEGIVYAHLISYTFFGVVSYYMVWKNKPKSMAVKLGSE
jgi:hypothetical protein